MKEILVLTGPTGAGKTFLSIKIAKKLDLEIISADSRQVYKYLNIGTNKTTKEEMEGIPHHLIDFLDPNEEYTAHSFVEDATQIIEQNKNVMIVGGTNFYINALFNETLNAPKVSLELRDALIKEFETDRMKLHKELQDSDPKAAAKIHFNDSYRLVRALSVIRSTGKKYSEFKETTLASKYQPKYILLNLPRADLHTRINDRVDQMVASGLFEEVENILNMGYKKNIKALNTIGYKEVIEYFDNKISKEECIESIKAGTRQFAKRQITWLRSLKAPIQTAEEILESYSLKP